MSVGQVTSDESDTCITQTNRPIVVDFWQAHYPSCQMLEQVARIYVDNVAVFRVDVDHDMGIVQRFNVVSILRFIALQDRKVAKRLDGLITRDQLETLFDNIST